MRTVEVLKIINKLTKKLKLTGLVVAIQVMGFTFFNQVALADRAQAQQKLKTDGGLAIAAVTDVTQWLGYGAAGLALVFTFVASLVINDEQALNNVGKKAKIIGFIAFLVGFSSTIITLITGK